MIDLNPNFLMIARSPSSNCYKSNTTDAGNLFVIPSLFLPENLLHSLAVQKTK